MKSLQLACHCGVKKVFRAEEVKGIIKQIDASGWKDRGWLTDGEDALPMLPRGQTYGVCPEHADDFNDPRIGETLGTVRDEWESV